MHGDWPKEAWGAALGEVEQGAGGRLRLSQQGRQFSAAHAHHLEQRAPERSPLCPGTTRHPWQLPCPYLHAGMTGLLSGPRGECDLDPRMS